MGSARGVMALLSTAFTAVTARLRGAPAVGRRRGRHDGEELGELGDLARRFPAVLAGGPDERFAGETSVMDEPAEMAAAIGLSLIHISEPTRPY